MNCHYPLKTLAGDYLRGGFGFVVTGGLVAFASMMTWIQYLFAVAAIMFAGFLFRTWQRHRTRYMLDDTGIRADGPFGRAIRWSEIIDLRLRYFSTRRDRKSGWFQLTIHDSSGRMSVDSNLDGFDQVLQRCAKAARANRLQLRESTAENFAAAGCPITEPTGEQPDSGLA